jgi:hypothetical protein
MTTFNEIYEQFLGTGCKDSKGREIGYIVGFNDNNTEFFAWVQNARKLNGEWKQFGVPQRSKSFPTQEAANRWAYATAKQRIAKVRA